MQSDGVGLTLRTSSDGNEFVAFYVSPTDGSWTLARYKHVDDNADDNWNTLDSSTSNAINTGSGAANQLLVLMRDDAYLLYVNNHFIKLFHDNSMHLPTSGHMGVYVNDGVTTGASPASRSIQRHHQHLSGRSGMPERNAANVPQVRIMPL